MLIRMMFDIENAYPARSLRVEKRREQKQTEITSPHRNPVIY